MEEPARKVEILVAAEQVGGEAEIRSRRLAGSGAQVVRKPVGEDRADGDCWLAAAPAPP
jgi:hypothetical protein